jgi:Pyruvate/2-oxoacid:ferredoxin oxidoreductase gamma subunit
VEHWEAAIGSRFTAPEVLDQNLKAFHRGRDYVSSLAIRQSGN